MIQLDQELYQVLIAVLFVQFFIIRAVVRERSVCWQIDLLCQKASTISGNMLSEPISFYHRWLHYIMESFTMNAKPSPLFAKRPCRTRTKFWLKMLMLTFVRRNCSVFYVVWRIVFKRWTYILRSCYIWCILLNLHFCGAVPDKLNITI